MGMRYEEEEREMEGIGVGRERSEERGSVGNGRK